MMKRILFSIAVIFLGLPFLEAQNTCTEQLKLTQRSFDDGLLDDIPQLLADCMKDGFTKEEKANAYKLLIQTYLYSEQYEKADEVMIQFLNEFPSYKIAVNDPKEFLNLRSTYRTDPIFKLEIVAGADFCMPSVVQYYGNGDINSFKPKYTSKLGYTFELNYIDNLYRNLSYSIGAMVALTNLDYSNKPVEYSTVTGTFKNNYVGVPVSLRYSFKIGGFNLYSKLGVEPVYLITSTVAITRTDLMREPISASENLLSAHRSFDLRPFAGIGASLNLGRDQILFSAGYKFSTRSQLNPDKLYSNLTLSEKYNFVEDDILMNQAFVSVSYIRPIYKPKKIK
jgi:hypothetical protein